MWKSLFKTANSATFAAIIALGTMWISAAPFVENEESKLMSGKLSLLSTALIDLLIL